MPGTGLRQKFSRPENNRQILSSWERFMAGQDPGTDALRRLIDDSWRRCRGTVDPGRDRAPQAARGDALHDLLAGNDELVRASATVMASARDFLFETGTVMVLTDARGMVLSVEGDNALRDPTEVIHLTPGANWSEQVCGTNAIGTALEIGQPIQIHSAEHYCSGIQRWSCSASVIREPVTGTILGAIDLSGLTESYSRHSLALAIAAAGRIENRLAQREMTLRYRLLDRCLDRLSAPGRDGLILFDRSGRAIKTNDRAAALMAELAKERGERTTIRDLTLPWKRGRIVPENMPDWIERDWIEPIHQDGERLGAVLILPDRRPPLRGAAPRRAVGQAEAASALFAPSPAAPAARATPSDAAPPGAAMAAAPGSFPGMSCADGPLADAPSPPGADPFDRLAGDAPAYREAVRRARLLAKSPAPLLLQGETGVGKDAFAQALHEAGPRASGPFVAINCGGFSRELLTSELFGYAEGAFTGARRGGMIGKIEAADGGTLFLDEIGEMPLDLQPHLLRVLETNEMFRIGETRPRRVALRLVAATNRDLREEVRAGRFRMDLYYRIAVTSLALPPLRDRRADIPALAHHLLRGIAGRYACPVPEIDPALMDELAQHDWPGNIRELRNTLEAMMLESGGERITPAHRPPDLFGPTSAPAPASGPAIPLPEEDALSPSAPLSPLDRAEREAILAAIQRNRGNLTGVARELGIAKSTLYARLDRFALKGSVARLRTE